MSGRRGVTLVLGATGDTGRYVVFSLLEQNCRVLAIVRSRERMISALNDIYFSIDKSKRLSVEQPDPLLTIVEASVADLTPQQVQDYSNQVDHVICCLGHKGVYSHPRRLVSDTVQRFAQALAQTTGSPRKFIIMTSDGVPHPNDDPYGFWTRCTMSLIRRCIPPHADNEAVGEYLYNLVGAGNMAWVMVRPPFLRNGPVTKYVLYDKPMNVLFGNHSVTRANVAKFMVDLVLQEDLFAKYKFRMPVVMDETEPRKQTNRGRKHE
jgi:nucleoside-diphosphate-sugar epimerase